MFTLLSVHPLLVPLDLKRKQVAHVAATIAAIQGPVVVVGDWNMLASDRDMRPLVEVAGLRNVFDPYDLGNVTYVATRPASDNAIDHVYFRGGGVLELVGARVLTAETEGISDHVALVATFQVQAAAAAPP